MRFRRTPIGALAARAADQVGRVGIGMCLVAAASACKPGPLANVTPLGATTRNIQSLHLEYTVEGQQLATAADVVYYVVLDTNGRPEDGPQFNGAAPLSHPAPDPRSLLPFVRDEADILDRQPAVVDDASWTDYFALSQVGGRWRMWQGRHQADGSVTEQHRQLNPGDEWGIKDGRTVQLRVALSELMMPPRVPSQLEANLAVARRGPEAARILMVDAWRPPAPTVVDPSRRPEAGLYHISGIYSQAFFVIPTNGETRTDTDASAIAVPGNTVGRADALNVVSYTAHIGPQPNLGRIGVE